LPAGTRELGRAQNREHRDARPDGCGKGNARWRRRGSRGGADEGIGAHGRYLIRGERAVADPEQGDLPGGPFTLAAGLRVVDEQADPTKNRKKMNRR
jgi:hypothetical protein